MAERVFAPCDGIIRIRFKGSSAFLNSDLSAVGGSPAVFPVRLREPPI
jgi:hypothetical protein